MKRTFRSVNRLLGYAILIVIAVASILWVFQPEPLWSDLLAIPWWLIVAAFIVGFIAIELVGKALPDPAVTDTPPPHSEEPDELPITPEWHFFMFVCAIAFPIVENVILKPWFKSLGGVNGRGLFLLTYAGLAALGSYLTAKFGRTKATIKA